MARNPNAYVPPGARRGGYAAAAGRSPAPGPVQAPKSNGQVPLSGNKAPLVPLGNGKGASGAGKPPQPAAVNKETKPTPSPAPAATPEAIKKAPSPVPATTDKAPAPAPAPASDKKAEDASAPLSVPGVGAGGAGAAPDASSPVPTAVSVSPNAAADGTVSCKATGLTRDELTTRTPASLPALSAPTASLWTMSAKRWSPRSSLSLNLSGKSSWPI